MRRRRDLLLLLRAALHQPRSRVVMHHQRTGRPAQHPPRRHHRARGLVVSLVVSLVVRLPPLLSRVLGQVPLDPQDNLADNRPLIRVTYRVHSRQDGPPDSLVGFRQDSLQVNLPGCLPGNLPDCLRTNHRASL
jgi:hypothetical protein